MTDRPLFIVNPAAGHGRAGGFWRRVGPLVAESFGEHDARWTEGPGHASELAAEALGKGVRRVVAVGGDGTLSEVAAGFMRVPEPARSAAAVGLLPAGSGCDFARHFGLPLDPRKGVPALAAARPRRIDVGAITYTSMDGRERKGFFVNVAMFGIAGDVAVSMERSGKPFGGTVSYLVSSVAALLRARPKACRLSLDGGGEERRPIQLVALANTSTTGGGMRIAPGADASDGRFDYVEVGALDRWTLLRNFPRIYAGTHLGIDGVVSGRVGRLTARPESQDVFLNIDGEAAGRLPASFEVLPGALQVLLP